MLFYLPKTKNINTADFQKRWPELKQKIKDEHPDIDDNDLDYELGKEIELLERLQEKTRKTKKEIYEWLHLMG